jgi:serpin B
VDAAFTRLDGSQVTVPMMHQTEIHEYTDGPGYQALELDYRSKCLSMVVLLPSAGDFEDFQASLDADGLGAILDGLSKRSVVTALPKFGIESGSLSLKDTLVAMGMVTPFGGEADFTGMYAPGGIYIDDAYHKTFVAVDEKGTEAAAATAIVFREVSIPSGPEVEFTADRPFLFLIRDRGTGTILFFGRVLDPVAE